MVSHIILFQIQFSIAHLLNSICFFKDSIYTERFMGLPTKEDNLAGYEEGDVTLRATNLRGKHFLLMHGNADDNVHYQNAMALARVLQENDIAFEQMVNLNIRSILISSFEIYD